MRRNEKSNKYALFYIQFNWNMLFLQSTRITRLPGHESMSSFRKINFSLFYSIYWIFFWRKRPTFSVHCWQRTMCKYYPWGVYITLLAKCSKNKRKIICCFKSINFVTDTSHKYLLELCIQQAVGGKVHWALHCRHIW